VKSIARQLAEFVTRRSWGTLPEQVRHQARRCLLGTIGAMVAGEWSAAGPYSLQRETTQSIPAQIGDDGKTELILPLNVWPNLPVTEREVEVRLYLPGRLLAATLDIDTT